MNTTGGYEFEIVGGQLVKDYECPICLLLIKLAVELPCTHALCRSCLTKWEEDSADRNAGLLCPSCKSAYQHNQVTASGFTDRIITGTLEIKCKENKYGCQWTGTICDYNDHEKKRLFTLVNCDLVGCGERVRIYNLEEHMKICEFRLVQCSYCGAEEQFNYLEEHHQICKSYPIVCMNKECEITMQRKEVPLHIENNCQYQIIDCHYKSIGCDVRIQRKNHQNHIDTSVQKHMELLLEHSMHTTIQLTETKQILETTRVQFQITNQILTKELHTTEINLDENRKELKVTQEKLTKIVKTEQKLKDDLEKMFNYITENFKRIEEKTITVKDEYTKVLSLSTKKSNILIDFKSFESWIKVLPEKAWKAYKEEQLQPEIEDCLYPARFEKLVNVMETNKIYYHGNNEIYLKVNLNDYINKTFIMDVRDISERTDYESHPNTIYYSDEYCIHKYKYNICVFFFLPGWTHYNTYAYVIHPQRDEEIQKLGTYNCFDAVLQQEYILYGEMLIKLKKFV